MYKWLWLAASVLLFDISAADEEERFERLAKSFPYSVSLYRMLGHDRELRPYYGADDELAQIIDGLNKEFSPRLRRSNGEQMKKCSSLSESFARKKGFLTCQNGRLYFSVISPRRIEFSGYACRFKFCRIFDA